jgi:hypothetical protein
MNIELTDKDVELILRALGREKASCQNAGFHHLAHMVSDLQARVKSQAQVAA